jgi:hypothetical protein
MLTAGGLPPEILAKYQPVIGLETHLQLVMKESRSKILFVVTYSVSINLANSLSWTAAMLTKIESKLIVQRAFC